MIEEEGEGDFREKIKKIREELKVCRKEKEEYLAGWQRAKADFINARKDEEKLRENFLKFAEENLLREFLAIADSLELAIKLRPSEGVEQIYSQLRGLLKKYGVSPIESLGKKFDPLEHEAIEKVEVSEAEREDVVLEELQRGWRLHEKVLRPAKVKVGVLKK
ncbi:nucleotide exchange factor GrpE [Candidatus Giovannonibacteria bacterium RIFCSPHIGHO2_01_FULL_48_47]|nr:MAG: nucleotide exchange factor GrpE [Candidatus Giovannonibacteria bacterium RIFCSPHIGHO2_01_FULL_48_47]OGF67952.1 MAG: nucleotide exchange factor GrpE [Candidatus Giovannonibacteria bacterium RIFCSPHIGHO2_02_FULL_48_15]OGF88154.1 MAG: nucleotide exchange factor GrpE [Candidatus Giovannonibacteria bacterium RIFCSPLOWO2_01_FULL_48_47]OGF94937.1 MAG: nucleotide exchange factor GrpE [Candidatus Giovannonibacteria bacterium RIFOXYC1_FULL_48_8]OGF96222.1 MAG: nucleotide exchange factor GrpE [Can